MVYEHRGALRGTPGSACPQPEPNATELPSSAPGRPELVELKAAVPSPTPIRAEEHITTTPDSRPRAPAPSPTPTRAKHLAGLQIVRLRALARRRAPKRSSHVAALQTLPRFAPSPTRAEENFATRPRASCPRGRAPRSTSPRRRAVDRGPAGHREFAHADTHIATTPGCGHASHRAFAHADTRRGTHRQDAGLQTSRPRRQSARKMPRKLPWACRTSSGFKERIARR